MKLPSLHPDFLKKPLAHRGLHDAKIPENSLAAFSAAIDKNYGIELDLQLSEDGEVMVFHDYDLGRLTDHSGPVYQHTAAQLSQTHLSNGEPIPTLKSVLDRVAGQAPLLIEIKDQDGALGPNVDILERRLADILKTYHGPMAVMSFNPHSVHAMQDFAPNIPRGLVTSRFSAESWLLVPEERLTELAEIPDFEKCAASFISHQIISLREPRVAEIKASGAPILCWTTKSHEEELEARAVADNVTFEGYLP